MAPVRAGEAQWCPQGPHVSKGKGNATSMSATDLNGLGVIS